MRGAILQIAASDNPAQNLATVTQMMRRASEGEAQIVFTPEVTNCVSTSRTHQHSVLHLPEHDPTLAGLRATAKDLGLWLSIGSLAVKTGDADGRFANRSYLINPDGEIVAQYDKIHMFDVEIDAQETYRESSGYRPGDRAVLAETTFGTFGLSICYDMRFPALYQALARAGATILTVPAAFSPVTGAAHWHSLLRARAIETGCFVIAAAQSGTHEAQRGKARTTYGHSLVVSPWGEVLLDAGTACDVYPFELNLASVDDTRRRVPALCNARNFTGP